MKKLTLISLILLAALLWVRAETVPQTQTVIKSHFQTGLRPTQDYFFEWIDTMFYYINATYTNAVAAATAAQSVQTLYQAYGNFTVSVTSSITTTVNNNYNVASFSITNVQSSFFLNSANNNGGTAYNNLNRYKCNVVFSNTLPGVNYVLQFSSPACVATFSSGNETTTVRLDGLGCPIATAQTLTATNALFYIYATADANLNGLNIRVIAQ